MFGGFFPFFFVDGNGLHGCTTGRGIVQYNIRHFDEGRPGRSITIIDYSEWFGQ